MNIINELNEFLICGENVIQNLFFIRFVKFILINIFM